MLNQWSDIFERNSINAGMSISMTKISKEEAIRAISETVEREDSRYRIICLTGKNLKNLSTFIEAKNLCSMF